MWIMVRFDNQVDFNTNISDIEQNVVVKLSGYKNYSIVCEYDTNYYSNPLTISLFNIASCLQNFLI